MIPMIYMKYSARWVVSSARRMDADIFCAQNSFFFVLWMQLGIFCMLNGILCMIKGIVLHHKWYRLHAAYRSARICKNNSAQQKLMNISGALFWQEKLIKRTLFICSAPKLRFWHYMGVTSESWKWPRRFFNLFSNSFIESIRLMS